MYIFMCVLVQSSISRAVGCAEKLVNDYDTYVDIKLVFWPYLFINQETEQM